jgi:hypothetical protein
MSRHATIALLFAAAIGSAASAMAADDQGAVDSARSRGRAAAGAAPIRLFEGREAGPNELHLVCVIDGAGGRLRRCPARD